jgi:archaellum component FlaF (FlaF/FlaG flagellin family)
MALMDSQGEPQRTGGSGLRSILPYTTVAMIIAALYVAWTFYSRHQSAQQAVQDAEQKKHDAEKKSYALVNPSSEVSFTTFGAGAAVVHPGETTQLCYGVLNAKHVVLDPAPAEELKPSIRHCIDIAPRKTTKYTLTADDGAGNSKTESIVVQVK